MDNSNEIIKNLKFNLIDLLFWYKCHVLYFMI